MLAGSSKGFQYVPGLSYQLAEEVAEDPFESTLVEGYRRRGFSEILLESKICQEWKRGRCSKGEKCRFRHQKSYQEQYDLFKPDESGVTSLSRKQKEEASDYEPKEDLRVAENGDEGVDNQGKEKDSQNDALPLFAGVLMTLLALEQLRQLIFKPDRNGYDEEKMKTEKVDTQRRLEVFDGLGNARREELAIVKHHESNSNGEIKRDGMKRWVEEEDSENQKNDINKILEALGRQRRERCLPPLETEWNLEETEGKGELREIPIDQVSADFVSTISQYIVLESNLVTCGAGLEIHQITPGYDLCQISLQLPIETTGTEIVEILLEEGLETSDFHILRIEETEERLEAIILTNIQFGNTLEHKKGAFGNRQISFEVRRDAIWTSGTMGPGNPPSLVLTWDSENSDLSLPEETSHIALAEVYDSLFELEGARMESCCLLTPNSESGINQVTLTVEFDSWENAMEAARDIESKRPKGIPSFLAKTPKARQQSIIIPLLQYEAQRRQWLELSDTESEEEKIEIEIINDAVMIQVQGEKKTLVGALKVRVEKLARGEVLDETYWHPSFASSEESASFFREVMESTAVYLKCCSDAHTLVLYGEFGYIEDARRMILAEVDHREQVMTKTALTGPSIAFFKNGGIQKLKDLVGEKKANLKSNSRWSAIMMQGGETATHHLRRLIKESLVKGPIGFLEEPTAATTCPVCLEEQLHPEILECGHGYCSECLDRFLKAAADNKNFPIVCVGEGATCNVPIALPFIRRFVPHHTFKHLVEAAFAAYLERNPTQFRYCKTPDCRQTYRRQSANQAATITCPSCCAKICSWCSENHENLTCEEYRIHHDPEEQERLNDALASTHGYKRCPRCAVWVEKTGGCNHMNCKCGAHICWICLGIFDDADGIYVHIATHD